MLSREMLESVLEKDYEICFKGKQGSGFTVVNRSFENGVVELQNTYFHVEIKLPTFNDKLDEFKNLNIGVMSDDIKVKLFQSVTRTMETGEKGVLELVKPNILVITISKKRDIDDKLMVRIEDTVQQLDSFLTNQINMWRTYARDELEQRTSSCEINANELIGLINVSSPKGAGAGVPNLKDKKKELETNLINNCEDSFVGMEDYDFVLRNASCVNEGIVILQNMYCKVSIKLPAFNSRVDDLKDYYSRITEKEGTIGLMLHVMFKELIRSGLKQRLELTPTAALYTEINKGIVVPDEAEEYIIKNMVSKLEPFLDSQLKLWYEYAKLVCQELVLSFNKDEVTDTLKADECGEDLISVQAKSYVTDMNKILKSSMND